MELLVIIGAISGVVSFVGIIYMVSYWKARVDSDLKICRQCLKDYPPQETAMMVKTMWDIVVVDALRGRPDLAESHSTYRLKKEGKDLIPRQIKLRLDRVPLNSMNNEAVATGWLAVRAIGLEDITEMAEDNKLSIQESIAVISTYLEERRQNG